MKDTLIPANIIIADRSYRLKINASDEEVIRHTVKMINKKIIEYKTNFAGKDMQDYVSMALLWYAAEQQKPTPEQSVGFEQNQHLKKIEQLLDKAML